MNWRGCETKRLVGLRKTAKTLNKYDGSPGRSLNPGPIEYEAGVLCNSRAYLSGSDMVQIAIQIKPETQVTLSAEP
jgi:hypothetical protein